MKANAPARAVGVQSSAKIEENEAAHSENDPQMRGMGTLKRRCPVARTGPGESPENCTREERKQRQHPAERGENGLPAPQPPEPLGQLAPRIDTHPPAAPRAGPPSAS